MEFTQEQLTAMRDLINTIGPSTRQVPYAAEVYPKGSAADKTHKDLLKIIDELEQNHTVTINLAK